MRQIIKHIRKTFKLLGVGHAIRLLNKTMLYFLVFPAGLVYLELLLVQIITGRTVKFVYVYCNRIGHLACETELFIRRLENGVYEKNNTIYIGVCSEFPVCNRQLLNMFKRKLWIIESSLMDLLIRGTWLRRTQFYHLPPFKDHNEHNSNEFFEFTNFNPTLSFTKKEELKGKKLLKEMGIGENDWFVCFHSRDRAYVECDRLNFRNSEINNYLLAMGYIVKKGGFAIRMGNGAQKPLPKNRNPKIIDYALDFRSDFMDIYLSAHCKIFVGDGCGINQAAQIFHVPVAWANVIPLQLPPYSGRDVFIPKKLWSIEANRLLSFKEIVDNGILSYYSTDKYEQAGINIIEHSPNEILDLVTELNERLDGNFKYSSEDEDLQKRYSSLFNKAHHCYGCPARVGAKYLRDNKELLR